MPLSTSCTQLDDGAIISDVDAALDRLEAEAIGTRIAEALGQLPPGSRDALFLHVWADLSYEQVAEATQVSVGTVRSRIHRARTHLRRALTEEILT